MRYTGDVHSSPGPYILHYGIDWSVQWKDSTGIKREYAFNKLLYLSLDPASCPRWFFPLAPYNSEERDPTDTESGPKRYRDAVCGRQMATFNRALCEYYGRHCLVAPRCPPDSAELARKTGGWCVDLNQNCLNWARRGECISNPGFSDNVRLDPRAHQGTSAAGRLIARVESRLRSEGRVRAIVRLVRPARRTSAARGAGGYVHRRRLSRTVWQLGAPGRVQVAAALYGGDVPPFVRVLQREQGRFSRGARAAARRHRCACMP